MRIQLWLVLVPVLVLASACAPLVPRTPGKPASPVPAATNSRDSSRVGATSQGPTSTPGPLPSQTPARPVGKPAVTPAATPSAGAELPFPIRAAFYYPWFPQAWNQQGMNPFTHYRPTSGFYKSSDAQIIQKHIAAMQYGKIQAGIVSWWGQGQPTDARIPALLKAGEEMGFSWALYMESEGQGDPTVEAIRADLTYIRDHYADSPAYMKIGERFLVFVYADPKDSCAMASRWNEANTVGAYVVLKVFEGYRSCPDQPDGWHQYAPANANASQDLYSYTISPGFWKATESKPRLERNLDRWQSSIRSMMASGADFQLISTFNEWGEGTAVENAKQWTSPSGYGLYLDALHFDGNIPAALPPQKDNLPLVEKLGNGSIFVGAGDIGECGGGSGQTAAILARLPGVTFFTAGDNAYPDGSLADFMKCFDPTWGKYKARIHPAAGNHEYQTQNASGYFNYFGAAAGTPGKGYYSYNLPGWHIIVLNSNCGEVSGCQAGSPQETWLKADLAAHPAPCTLAYWHHPLFSSGQHGSNSSMRDLWQTLYAAGVELVINGHDHDYERFAPQNPDGKLDPQKGIRQIVVGTGGASHYNVGSKHLPNSEKVITGTYGLLKLNLRPGEYTWTFLPVAGKTDSDQGTEACH